MIYYPWISLAWPVIPYSAQRKAWIVCLKNPRRCATNIRRAFAILCLFTLCLAPGPPGFVARGDSFSSPAGGIVNGDFEQGSTGWTEYSELELQLIYHEDDLIVATHSGQWAAWLAGANDEISYIEQRIDVLADDPVLIYWFRILSGDECDADDDRGEVRIDGTVVDTLRLCEARSTLGWAQRYVDLSAYAGQTVDLQIRAETNDAYLSDLFIDDVSMTTGIPLRLFLPLVVRSQ